MLRQHDMRAIGCKNYCRWNAKLHTFFRTQLVCTIYLSVEFGITG